MAVWVSRTAALHDASARASTPSGSAIRSTRSRREPAGLDAVSEANFLEDAVAQLAVAPAAEVAWVGNVDGDDAADGGGPGGHHHHPVGELQRLVDVVG